MTDLAGILIRLQQLDQGLRELAHDVEPKSDGLLRKIEGLQKQSCRTVNDLERYLHAGMSHHAIDDLQEYR
jgi:hypothetical protein